MRNEKERKTAGRIVERRNMEELLDTSFFAGIGPWEYRGTREERINGTRPIAPGKKNAGR